MLGDSIDSCGEVDSLLIDAPRTERDGKSGRPPPARKAAPEIAELVVQGELTLEDAAKQAGVVAKKRINPSVAKPVTQDAEHKSGKSTRAANKSLWQDELTEITDRPDGLRTLRCPHATFYTHKSEAITGVVMPEGDEWWWYAGTEEDQGITSLREEAEQCLLKCFAVIGSGTR